MDEFQVVQSHSEVVKGRSKKPGGRKCYTRAHVLEEIFNVTLKSGYGGGGGDLSCACRITVLSLCATVSLIQAKRTRNRKCMQDSRRGRRRHQ